MISRVVYYGTTFYPDCTVTFKLRRASWVDRKVVVLPIIRENFLDALMDMNGLKTGMGNLHFILSGKSQYFPSSSSFRAY